MMKKIIVAIFFITKISFVSAQIGVFTDHPQGVFHIDGKGNNTTDLSFNSDLLKDDVVVKGAQGGINLSIGGVSSDESSAQLELGGTQSGFVPNKVALVSLLDTLTVPNPVDGMLIYNTTKSEELVAGLYYFESKQWKYLKTRAVASVIEIRDLWYGSTDVTVPPNSGTFSVPRYANAHTTPSGGAWLYWANPISLSDQPKKEIEISEDGAYAFSLHIYGSVPSTTTADRRLVLYLWLVDGTTSSPSTAYDVAELDVLLPANKANFTYSVTMAANLSAGQIVSLVVGSTTSSTVAVANMIGNPRTESNVTSLPERTSLVFWKL